MSQPIINQPWEDVASDVTAAIELAVQPLIKRAADDIYAGLLDTTQDYLRDNLAFNIASRIDAAEREARDVQQINAVLLDALIAVRQRGLPDRYTSDVELADQVDAAIAKAKGGAA